MQLPDDIPELRLRDALALKEEGYDPKDWINQKQMAAYWRVALKTIYNRKFEEFEDKAIQIRRIKYYPIEVLTTYRSDKIDELEDEILQRSLGHRVLARTEEVIPPAKRTQADYLQRLAGVVSLTDWEDIIKKAVVDAKEGDSRARQWLSDHLIGTPVQKVAALVSDIGADRFSEEDRRKAVIALITGELDDRFTRPLYDAEGDDSDS